MLRQERVEAALFLSKLINNCCQKWREQEPFFCAPKDGKKSEILTLSEIVDLLHDTALGVLQPGNWRAIELPPISLGRLDGRLDRMEQMLCKLTRGAK